MPTTRKKTILTDELIQQVHDYWINPETREMWIHGIEKMADSEYISHDGVHALQNRLIHF